MELQCIRRDVAQLASAPRSGRGGRKFESSHPDLSKGRNTKRILAFFISISLEELLIFFVLLWALIFLTVKCMKTILCVVAILMLGIGGTHAQRLKSIQLDAPDKTRGSSVMKALADRHSVREYANKKLSQKDLSDLLWAANGINREDGRRTAASALNKQDVDIYVFMEEGAYLYDAKAHKLNPVVEGDHRSLIGGKQTSVNSAPACLLLVTDYSRFGTVGSEESRKQWGAFDAGLVSQNIALFCTACGLATVPRGSMDVEGLTKLLNLSATQIPVINNPVGYEK